MKHITTYFVSAYYILQITGLLFAAADRKHPELLPSQPEASSQPEYILDNTGLPRDLKKLIRSYLAGEYIQLLALTPIKKWKNRLQPWVANCFSSNRKFIAQLSADGTIEVWDVQTGALHKKIAAAPSGALTKILFSPDNSRIIQKLSQTIIQWDINTGGCETAFCLPKNTKHYACSPDCSYIAVGTVDGTLQLIRPMAQRSETIPGTIKPDKFEELALSKSQSLLAAVIWKDRTLNRRKLTISNVTEKQLRGSYDFPQPTGITLGITFSPDEKYIAIANFPATITIFSVADKQWKHHLPGILRSQEGLSIKRFIEYSQDGKYLHFGGSAIERLNLDILQTDQIYRAQNHSTDVDSQAHSANLELVAEGTCDEIIISGDMGTELAIPQQNTPKKRVITILRDRVIIAVLLCSGFMLIDPIGIITSAFLIFPQAMPFTQIERSVIAAAVLSAFYYLYLR